LSLRSCPRASSKTGLAQVGAGFKQFTPAITGLLHTFTNLKEQISVSELNIRTDTRKI
jgi:hypothetical protein